MTTRSPRFSHASPVWLGLLVSLAACGNILGLDGFTDETRSTATTTGAGGSGAGGKGAGGSGIGGKGAGGKGAAGGGGGAGMFCVPGSNKACAYGGLAGTENVGACHAGVETCLGDGTAYGACSGEVDPVPEDCATPLDDNCDGAVNENCQCTAGMMAGCYDGPAGTSGVGLCHDGMHTCNANGMGYGPCGGEVTPSAEVCDGQPNDENCDGQVNEGGQGCVCAVGSMTACYDGPAGTVNVGICVGGMKTCAADGITYGACGGEVLPAAETCTNTADENCDGHDCIIWDKRHGDATDGGAQAVGVDASGNVYVAGFFTGSLLVDNLPPLLSSGANDVFVIKYDPVGNAIWSEKFGLASDQAATGLAVDASGNVVLVGYFNGSIALGANMYTALAGETRIFVAKLDPMGVVQWSAEFLSATARVAVDPIPLNQGGGNIAVAGTTVTGTDANAFVRKYSPAGALIFTKSYGDATSQSAEDVAMDGAGNIIVSGEFNGSINFGLGAKTSVGGLDAFVAKLDSSGTEAWSKQFGDAADQYGNGVTVAPTGEVAVCGAFYGSVNLGGTNKVSAGNADIFVGQFSAGGAHLWSAGYGDAVLQSCRRVATDTNKDVIATGWIFGGTNFGGGLLTSAGAEDIFVAKFDTTGKHIWSKKYGDAATQLSQAMAVGENGDVVIAGWYKGTVDFGLGPLTSAGGYDMFVAELGP